MKKATECKHIDKNGCKCKNKGLFVRGKECFPKGYCDMHYNRFRKYGDPNFTMTVRGENRGKNPLYKTWNSIKYRCYNENSQHYKYYGARGIRMSDEWLDLETFSKDMGEKPSKLHTVERDDVDGNYCKENCRWATWHEQQANKRNNNKIVGVRYNKKSNRWVARLEVGKVTHGKTFKTPLIVINLSFIILFISCNRI